MDPHISQNEFVLGGISSNGRARALYRLVFKFGFILVGNFTIEKKFTSINSQL